jgi:hypothetical protein
MSTARTADQILADWATATANIDSTVDTKKGPLYDFVGSPLSQVLSTTEANVDALSQLYSADFASTATDIESQVFLTNWSEAAGTGNLSTTIVYFMKFSAPSANQVINIPVGTIVGNSNQTLQYVTTQSAQINGLYAANYYNPNRRTYEVAVPVQAVGPGPQYDLPAQNINVPISQITGIDAVENRVAASGGVAAETPQQQVTRVQQKLEGLAINTGAGAETRIKSYNPSLIQAVNVVLSSDRQLFQRVTYLPGNDYYILGSLPYTTNLSYTSNLGGETNISLSPLVPVLSINSVQLNNVTITNWSLQSDQTQATGSSAVAQDLLVLGSPLISGDVLIINLTYDSLIQGVQQNVLSSTGLWQTSELARKFFNVGMVMTMTAKALPSYDPVEVQNSCLAALQTIIQPGYWQQEIDPNNVITELQNTVPGLSGTPIFQAFHRATLSTGTIEAAIFNKTEIAYYDPNLVSVTIGT